MSQLVGTATVLQEHYKNENDLHGTASASTILAELTSLQGTRVQRISELKCYRIQNLAHAENVTIY